MVLPVVVKLSTPRASLLWPTCGRHEQGWCQLRNKQGSTNASSKRAVKRVIVRTLSAKRFLSHGYRLLCQKVGCLYSTGSNDSIRGSSWENAESHISCNDRDIDMGHYKHRHRVGLHLPPGMSEAEQCCFVCGDKSYVILQVLQMKMPCLEAVLGTGATWHDHAACHKASLIWPSIVMASLFSSVGIYSWLCCCPGCSICRPKWSRPCLGPALRAVYFGRSLPSWQTWAGFWPHDDCWSSW